MRWILPMLVVAGCSSPSTAPQGEPSQEPEAVATAKVATKSIERPGARAAEAIVQASSRSAAATTLSEDFGDTALHAREPVEEDAEQDLAPEAPLPVCAHGLSGDHPLIIVNKDRGHALSCLWAPDDLQTLDDSLLVPESYRAGAIELRTATATALGNMLRAAEKEDIHLLVRSGYRSYEEQERIHRHKVRRHGERHARRYSARPGRSQHQLGTTVDLTTRKVRYQVEKKFARTRGSKWLRAHAHEFGFVMSYPRGEEERTGYAFEPWHYRYIGVRAAAEMLESGLLLDDYLLECLNPKTTLRCDVSADPVSERPGSQTPRRAFGL